jgi:8-amino-7-oxononanoate synthase
MNWLGEENRRLEEQGLRRSRRTVTQLPDGQCRLDGRTLVDFSSNDYLGLAGDERLVMAAQTALQNSGCGARSSALVSGRTEWHQRLEERIAKFEGEESAVLFPSGYAANLGALTAILGSEDVVFCDRLNHASLIDGCRLSGAKLRVYRHDQLDRLGRHLEKTDAGVRRLWIVTDAVFSMDGDISPLSELCNIAEQFDAGVIVDEAHSTGVYGQLGRGLTEHLKLEDRVAVRIGTLSKAVGCLGGFVAGKKDLTDWLWNTARPQIFSTALPPAVCAAAEMAFDVIEAEPHRRERLHINGNRLREQLRQSGIVISESCIAPIIPVHIGDPEQAVAIAGLLEEDGFLVAAIRPPTVPQGTSRLRITVTSAHSDEQIEQLAAAIVKRLPQS